MWGRHWNSECHPWKLWGYCRPIKHSPSAKTSFWVPGGTRCSPTPPSKCKTVTIKSLIVNIHVHGVLSNWQYLEGSECGFQVVQAVIEVVTGTLLNLLSCPVISCTLHDFSTLGSQPHNYLLFCCHFSILTPHTQCGKSAGFVTVQQTLNVEPPYSRTVDTPSLSVLQGRKGLISDKNVHVS